MPVSTPRPRPCHPTPATSSQKLSSAKRARSPEPPILDPLSSKRLKPAFSSNVREDTKKDKDRKRTEREREFRVKYTRAFPSWIFYFDIDDLSQDKLALRDRLQRGVLELGARVDDLFSKDITHLITLQPEQSFHNKENSKTKPVSASNLLSPIKLKAKTSKEHPPLASEQLIKKALSFDIKVWNTEKLESVLDRCQSPSSRTATQPTLITTSATARSAPQPQPLVKQRSLTRLLESERLHGTTERDPTQKRHDYLYFSKGSHFVLVEDMKQEYATIAALEYPPPKVRDGKDKSEKPSYPVLYCHPLARGPFIPYDEREERRRERTETAEKEREHDRQKRKARLRYQERKHNQLLTSRHPDLRRSASMRNLQRRATISGGNSQYPPIDWDLDLIDRNFDGREYSESANASGYLASGVYMAASGNSVGITSTAGTTSTTGRSLHTLQLPARLKERLEQQIVTSRKVTSITPAAIDPLAAKENTMGPPVSIPHRDKVLLRKSKSTNTLKLPKREEGTKPGYCESCRVKFDDFTSHVKSRRHRKYAMDDANFVHLDYLLARVRRRTLNEVEGANQVSQSNGDTVTPDEVQWADWVEADEL